MDLARQMSTYAAYHRNRWNRLTHFVGVPAIVFAILIPMARVPLGGDITLAHVFVAVVLACYFALDVPIALAAAVAVGALLAAAVAAAASGAGWTWFAVFFAGGWIFQLVGHGFEGRRPALADNIWQIFVAPIFLVAELFFALGFRRDLLRRIDATRAGGAA
jgi:uncharacterized membrane protein YGL010W